MIWLPVVGKYADIDVYASIVAYANLLNRRGIPAETYIPASTPNYSIPAALRLKEYEGHNFGLQSNDKAIILDTSVPTLINEFVPDGQILELIDHHSGYEDYWYERIGDKAIIERIGAVATVIFERWGEYLDYATMSPEIAKLLLAAILDNTLYFNAEITTTRDHVAAEKLAQAIGTTVSDFAKWYFSEVSQTVLGNLGKSLSSDIKTVNLLEGNAPINFGQLTIWDAATILPRHAEISREMSKLGEGWLVNVICLADNKNYVFVDSPELAKRVIELLNAQENGVWLATDQMHLRKEIIKIFSGTEK